MWNQKSKNHHVCARDYIWNPTACAFKINRYLKCITDGEVIATVTKSYNEPESFNNKR